MTQIGKVHIVLDGIENNIDWQLSVVHHVLKFVVITILKHLWRDTAKHVLEVFTDSIDRASERVACPVAPDESKVGSQDSLNNLLNEGFIDALDFRKMWTPS
jgi:hypothetical protein